MRHVYACIIWFKKKRKGKKGGGGGVLPYQITSVTITQFKG